MTTKNMFKEVNVTKNRGHPGTGLTTAPVLLFELLPSDKLQLYESLFELLSAINYSSTSHIEVYTNGNERGKCFFQFFEKFQD